jgi:hypothetical protein
MAQKGCLHKVSDLLADCKEDEVLTFGGGKLCGYIATPAGLIPIGKELRIYIQLKTWKPRSILYQ